MATNDVGLQVINSMTQEQMQSLKDSSGKIPSLANQLIMTDEEDVNLSQLRTEVVYDMSSSGSNKNWGYSGGIKAGSVISGKDFSKYEKLIIYVQFAGQVSGTGFLDLSKTLDSAGTYRTKLAFGSEENTDIYICFVRVSADKTEFANGQMGFLRGSTFYDRGSSYGSYFIYKIEGILKQPAMIYTGAELHEGNGISIKDGVISSEHPIGSYHICKTGSSNPASLFGGTWKQIRTNVALPLGDYAPVYGTGAQLILQTDQGVSGITLTAPSGAGSLPAGGRKSPNLYNSSSVAVGNNNGIGIATKENTPYSARIRTHLSDATNVLYVDIWERES